MQTSEELTHTLPARRQRLFDWLEPVATVMSAPDTASAVTAMLAEDAALATTMPAEDAAAATAMPEGHCCQRYRRHHYRWDRFARPVTLSHAVEFKLTVSAVPAVGVELPDRVERRKSVAEVENLRGLTAGCSCDVGCICEDVTVCAAEHVSLLEVLARCLSSPWWPTLNRCLSS